MLKKLLISIFIIICFGKIYSQTDWQLIKNENDIQVYYKSNDNSDFIEVKAITIIDAEIDELVCLIRDVESYTTWVYGTLDSYIISSISDEEYIYYIRSDLPWPVSDRECVIKIRLNISNSEVYSQSICLNGYIAENEDCSRIYDLSGSWSFEAQDDGKVKLTYYLKLNPGLDLPDWILRTAADLAPYNTIVAMRDEVKKEKYKNCD